MSQLPLHPILVHLPIALAVLMPLISAGLLIAWWKSLLPKRAWWLVVALQAAMLVGSVAALRTGEADEERVERQVPEAAIEAHEEAAQTFTVAGAIVLVVTLVAAFLRSEKLAMLAAAAAVAGTLVVLWLGYRTGEAGGALVYRHGAASAYVSPTASPPSAQPRAGEDDD